MFLHDHCCCAFDLLGNASTEAYAEENRALLPEKVRRQGEVASRIAVLEEDWLWVSAELESRKQGTSIV